MVGYVGIYDYGVNEGVQGGTGIVVSFQAAPDVFILPSSCLGLVVVFAVVFAHKRFRVRFTCINGRTFLTLICGRGVFDIFFTDTIAICYPCTGRCGLEAMSAQGNLAESHDLVNKTPR
jgi:hypothetical protein